jgi:hypothetical protein
MRVDVLRHSGENSWITRNPGVTGFVWHYFTKLACFPRLVPRGMIERGEVFEKFSGSLSTWA